MSCANLHKIYEPTNIVLYFSFVGWVFNIPFWMIE